MHINQETATLYVDFMTKIHHLIQIGPNAREFYLVNHFDGATLNQMTTTKIMRSLPVTILASFGMTITAIGVFVENETKEAN